MCGGKRHKPASDEDEDIVASTSVSSFGETGGTFIVSGLQAPMAKPSELLAGAPAPSEPIAVYTGPARSGAALIAAVAADADSQITTRRHGKKSRLAARKPEPEAKSEANSEAKPAHARHASAKSDAKTDAKSDTKTDAAAKPTASDPSAKPAKPKAAAKPKPTPKSTSGDTKPAG
jgi:D-alanyl-D-alanine carboxypeptidase